MYELALFAGAGGGILGGMLCGHTCIGAVEIEQFPREILLQRQRDGILPAFPIWDDVCTFSIENPETAEYIERLRSIRENLIISGGFPCQDISAAGHGKGIGGERSGLWAQMARIIREIQPARVFVENSPLLVGRGLAVVLGDLAGLGYDARWCCLGTKHAGGYHARERLWLLGYSNEIDLDGFSFHEGAGSKIEIRRPAQPLHCPGFKIVRMVPRDGLSRMADDVADQLEPIEAIGNGQDAGVVYLSQRIMGGV